MALELEPHIPSPPFPVEILDEHGARVANPYTGNECFLNPVALAVYDMVKGAEMMQQYETVRVGVDWFIEHYPAEYMVLLD